VVLQIDKLQIVPATIQLFDRKDQPVPVYPPSINVAFQNPDLLSVEITPDGGLIFKPLGLGQTDITVTVNGVTLPVETLSVVNPPATHGNVNFGTPVDAA
jgi:hypothetical protein